MRALKNLPVHVVILMMLFPFIFPVFWGLMASFSTNSQITLNSLALPDRLRFSNYIYAWTVSKMGTYMFNSLRVSSISAIAISILSAALGYALARLQFPGRKLVYLVIMAAIIMPVFSYIVALVKITSSMKIMGTTALILTTVAVYLPVPTFMMRSFFMDVPEEFANAARVEGASEWQVFLDIMIPLARSGMLTVLIFSFVWAWNDILLPVVFLANPDSLTVPYGIAALRPADFRQDYVSVFAGSFLSTIPMILIYVFLMRRFIKGMAVGGLKF